MDLVFLHHEEKLLMFWSILTRSKTEINQRSDLFLYHHKMILINSMTFLLWYYLQKVYFWHILHRYRLTNYLHSCNRNDMGRRIIWSWESAKSSNCCAGHHFWSAKKRRHYYQGYIYDRVRKRKTYFEIAAFLISNKELQERKIQM